MTKRTPHSTPYVRGRAAVVYGLPTLLLALAVGPILASCAGEPSHDRSARSQTRVVLIVLDAARSDRFSSYGYLRETTPNLDALAREGVRFSRHYAHHTSTRESLTQLLFSRYYAPPLAPYSPKVPLYSPSQLFFGFDNESISLPRVLSGSGLYTSAISAHPWLREGSVFALQFDELRDLSAELGFNDTYEKPSAARVTDAGIEWIREHVQDSFFLYLHYMDTHFPHELDGSARRFLPSDLSVSEVRKRFERGGHPRNRRDQLRGAQRQYLDALYDGSLYRADREIGRLIEFLRDAGLLRDTLIVVTSDHGEALLEVPDRFEHGGPWYELVSRIPLIIYDPSRLAPAVHAGLSGLVDVSPTILDLLGVSPPRGKRLDGQSLVPAVNGERSPAGVVYAPQGIRVGRHKLLFLSGSFAALERGLARGRAPELAELDAALYDLESDPLETQDLLHQKPELAEALFERFIEHMAPAVRRYYSTRNSGPPETAFAISINRIDVQTGSRVEVHSSKRESGDLSRGWALNRRWNRYRLVARPGAQPIAFELDLPSGEYELSVGLRGSLAMTVAAGPRRELAGEPLAELPPPRDGRVEVELVPYGPIRVEENRLPVRLEPLQEEGFALVHYLGFRPAGKNGQQRPGFEAQLEALGYID